MLLKQNKCIIDGDSIIYIVCWKDEHSLDEKIKNVKSFIDNILEKNETVNYSGYLTVGRKSFRYDLSENYKIRRIKSKPLHFQEVKDYMIEELGFKFDEKYEADDLVYSEMCKDENGIVCHIDSDLNQIVGHHFNYKTNAKYYIGKESAEKLKWKLLLTGKSKDDVKGIGGIGDKKSDLIIALPNYQELITDMFLEKGKDIELQKKLIWLHNVHGEQSILKEEDLFTSQGQSSM